MDYITIVAPTYEDAVAKAKKEYGNRLRIHSRRTISKSGLFGLGKTTECELTCFLTEEPVLTKSEVDLASCEVAAPSELKEDEIKRFEKEAKTPDPDAAILENNVASLKIFEQAKRNIEAELRAKEEKSSSVEVKVEDKPKVENVSQKKDSEEVSKLLARVKEILLQNDFTSTYNDWLIDSIRDLLMQADPALPSDEELEVMVLDKIAESLLIDNSFGQNPERIVVVLGPTSSGKTTMVAKLASLFSSVNNTIRRNVRVVLLDDSPAVVNQLQKIGKALNIPVAVAPHESELSFALNAQLNNELVFVDAIGKPVQNNNPDYKIFGLLNVSNKSETRLMLVLPASMKNTDIARVFQQYKSCGISDLIITKLDETYTIGNVISASFEHKLPIVYLSTGKKIPKDISKATTNALLRMLQGFKININDVLASEL